MSKFSAGIKKFGGFLKRNAFYLLIILLIAAVATVIALAVTRNNGADVDVAPTLNPDQNIDSGDEQPDTPPAKQQEFRMPAGGNVSKQFYDQEVDYNSSLEQWEAHLGVDFVSDDLNVYAAADGEVIKADYDQLDGYYIVIQHEDGYTTKYMSLESADVVKTGDSVKQGQIIGKMSGSQGSEALDGQHLHFEMFKDGEQIDPMDVFMPEDK